LRKNKGKNKEDIANSDTSYMYDQNRIFYLSKKSKAFNISFSEIFKQNLDVYNKFSMRSKRNFKNNAEIILETYEDLFLDEGGRVKNSMVMELQNILYVKSIMMTKDNMAYEEFIDLIDFITTDNLLDVIDGYVEDSYTLSLDEMTRKTNKNVNPELQFQDKHAKMILKISALQKLMTPIISEYFLYNKSIYTKKNIDFSEMEDDDLDFLEEYNFEQANTNIFFYLLTKFSEEGVSLTRKIYKLVESRVSRTKYSDTGFWNMVKSRGITPESETRDIYRKIIANNIAKLKNNSNIVSYFQSVINNSIDYLLQNKFKVKINAINLNNVNNDNLSEYEKLEIQMLRKDEGVVRLRKLNIQENIKTLEQELDIFITNEELNEFNKRVITKNIMQERLLSLFISRRFDDKNAVFYLDHMQYMKTLFIMIKYMERHDFILLPRILTSKVVTLNEKVTVNGKRIRPRIMKGTKFKSILDGKFGYFGEVVQSPILSIIGTLYNNDFYDEEEEQLINDNVKVQNIADEILDFIALS
jgi:hypothetical protein